jgi:hypothetical protein
LYSNVRTHGKPQICPSQTSALKAFLEKELKEKKNKFEKGGRGGTCL